VIAADATTGFTEAQISDEIFGTGTDVVNLRSQYAACSFNALTFAPKNGTGYNNGVTTVNITNIVNGTADATIRNAVTTALIAKHGASPPSGVNYVMQCLPPGTTGSWIAYAYVNNYLSVYNNQWCNYPSAQMHEIGHNSKPNENAFSTIHLPPCAKSLMSLILVSHLAVGLGHSNEGTVNYGDQTGLVSCPCYQQCHCMPMCSDLMTSYSCVFSRWDIPMAQMKGL
jgi:hypothetical protein